MRVCHLGGCEWISTTSKEVCVYPECIKGERMKTSIRAIMWRWGDAKYDADRYQSQIKEFEIRLSEMRDIGGMNYDGMPRGTDVSDPTERRVEKILEICDLYEQTITHTYMLLNRTLDLMLKVDKLLEECSPMQRRIATMRYRDKRPWVYIGMKLNISEVWARKQDEMMCKFITEAYDEMQVMSHVCD